jgi:TetR/AcrR family transcriptional repressor of bet genes
VGRPDGKTDQRRAQLAESALQTLSEFGYARTSVRDIAQNSKFSHGVLHYYFKDKAELILEAVRLYGTRCVRRYDDLLATAVTGDELLTGFGARLAESLAADATKHRFWYDIRIQCLFDPAYQREILAIDGLLEEMVWRVVKRLAVLSERKVALPSVVVYGCLDGVFQKALLDHLAGVEGAPEALAEAVQGALPLFLDVE